MNIAVIFAGGAGRRMNTRALPKQFLSMHGKPVLIYTLEKFEDNAAVDKIVLVCIADYIDYAARLAADYHIAKLAKIVPGGASGQESIYNGLVAAKALATGEDIVLIHDGVRPLIDAATITACVSATREFGSAITTAPAIETIFAREAGDSVGRIFNRSECQMARAPQCFFLADILAAHERARSEGRTDFIDSAMLMQHYGAHLHTVTGPMENIKITTPTDFYLFRALLDAQENMQIVGL